MENFLKIRLVQKSQVFNLLLEAWHNLLQMSYRLSVGYSTQLY